MKDFAPAILIGAVLGFAALWAAELGLVLGALGTLILAVYYLRLRRPRALAWYLIGGSAVWLVLLVPIAVSGIVNPHQSATVPETYEAVFGALVVLGLGIGLLLWSTLSHAPVPVEDAAQKESH